MLSAIRSFFEARLAAPEDEERTESVQRTRLACAALLMEVINSDHELDERERERFLDVLRDSFDLAGEDLRTLAELAEQEARDATSLYEFTRLINDAYDYGRKTELVENMWRLAFSDERLHRYEDHLIRKVADLLHVPHSDFIRAKLKARDEAG